jgi:hypothetical protein
MCFTQQGSFSSAVRRSCGSPAPLQEQPTEEKSTMTLADVCDAIKFCGAMANAIAWARLRCCRGPRTHLWRRHVDCVGRLRVQVPRPTDDAPPPSARLCSFPTTDTAEVIANRRGSMRPTIGAGPRRPIRCRNGSLRRMNDEQIVSPSCQLYRVRADKHERSDNQSE